MIPAPLSPQEVKRRIHGRDEVALLDVREHGQYGEGHPLLAVPLPYSRLEILAPRLLPRRATPLILLDDNDAVAERAARRLAALGYSDIARLDGGAKAWAKAGFTLFKGVNVPSKTLGELVERELQIPSLTVQQLAALKAAGKPVLQLDGRPLEEYRRFTVPGAACCPNAELAHRLPAFGAEATTPVVVSCAGRTRSIVGAAGLIAAGVGNPVYALENGTQGWALAGWELERGAARLYPRELSANMLAASRARGSALLEKHRIPTVDAATLAAWRRDETRTLYLFDVRTPEEFAAGHLAKARSASCSSVAISAPGGQLVQATDQWIAVRNARVVLLDDTGLRAALAARWLKAMGHEAAVFDPEASRADWKATGREDEEAARGAALTLLEEPAPQELRRAIESGEAKLLDLRPSMTARKGMIAGARWSIRPRLTAAGLARLELPPGEPLALTAETPEIAALAALDLAEAGHEARWFLPPEFAGGDRERFENTAEPPLPATGKLGTDRAAHADEPPPPSTGKVGTDRAAHTDEPPPPLRGRVGVGGGTQAPFPTDEDAIDHLFFVHDRHAGNAAAMRAYLAWEQGLIAQLDTQERAVFRV